MHGQTSRGRNVRTRSQSSGYEECLEYGKCTTRGNELFDAQLLLVLSFARRGTCWERAFTRILRSVVSPFLYLVFRFNEKMRPLLETFLRMSDMAFWFFSENFSDEVILPGLSIYISECWSPGHDSHLNKSDKILLKWKSELSLTFQVLTTATNTVFYKVSASRKMGHDGLDANNRRVPCDRTHVASLTAV